MTNSILLSVGCNQYDHIGNLASAESDAAGIFEALTVGPAALYSHDTSRLLLSPGKGDIEAALQSLLQRHKDLDTFALFFAGHGGMSDGSLYLCPRGTHADALSVTAINIAEILRAATELRPRQAYIVIDACQSGGVAFDLTAVLRQDISRKSPGFSLSVLSAAQPDQSAGETSAGGHFTTRILEVLKGDVRLNEHEPFLGLGDIVKAVRLPVSKGEQQPNLWSLNITGADAFCRNPNYSATSKAETPFGVLRFGPRRTPLSDELATDLWRSFLSPSAATLQQLPDLFAKVVKEQSGADGLLSSTYALTNSFAETFAPLQDTFARTLVHAAMARALMPYHTQPEGLKALEAQLELIKHSALAAVGELDEAMEREQYHLLAAGALPDLYHLPRRTSIILGWIGYLLLVLPDNAQADREALRDVTRRILSDYGATIAAVCDDQAAPLLLFLAQCKIRGWTDEGEEVVGRLYFDFNQHHGRVMVDDAPASDILDYLILRHENPSEAEADFLQNPSELFSIILVCAALFDLDDGIDTSLIQIDHTHFSFYVPSSYEEFWQECMESGEALIFQLGHALKPGYGVWTIGDMHRVWRHHIEPCVEVAAAGCSPPVLHAAAVASLIAPNRIAWFAVPHFVPRKAVPRTA